MKLDLISSIFHRCTMSNDRVPNEERRTASTQAVMTAARTLFVTHGYEYTSMAQIAKAAGLTKGTIYFYFKDKAELLFRLLTEAEAASFGPISQAIHSSQASAKERLILFINAVARLGIDHREQLLLPVLMAVEFSSSSLPAAAMVRAIYTRWTSMLEQLITDGQATGEFKESLDPANTAITLVALVDGLLLQWHRLHDDLDGPHLATTAREFVLSAVLK
ncbi:MAG TPA: TetR/AcrR family transcriptional regulator [Gammaproteobacteria bacterium]|nr:TetR/AcrR family transcriptional regulator [Gammaproteobacteria bacterium]